MPTYTFQYNLYISCIFAVAKSENANYTVSNPLSPSVAAQKWPSVISHSTVAGVPSDRIGLRSKLQKPVPMSPFSNLKYGSDINIFTEQTQVKEPGKVGDADTTQLNAVSSLSNMNGALKLHSSIYQSTAAERGLYLLNYRYIAFLIPFFFEMG
jgi:hypothetical protein